MQNIYKKADCLSRKETASLLPQKNPKPKPNSNKSRNKSLFQWPSATLVTVSLTSSLMKKSSIVQIILRQQSHNHSYTINSLTIVLPDVPETDFLIKMSTHYTLLGTHDVVAARSCKHCFYT